MEVDRARLHRCQVELEDCRGDRRHNQSFGARIVPLGDARQRLSLAEPPQPIVDDLDAVWRRIEADTRVAFDAVAARVAEQHAVGQHLERQYLAQGDAVVRKIAAHHEHVAEIRAEGKADRERHGVLVVVEQAKSLVEPVVVQKPIAANADGARLGHDLAARTEQGVVGELEPIVI